MKNDSESSTTKQDSLFDLEPTGIITTGEIRALRRLRRDLEALLLETPECSNCILKSRIVGMLRDVQMYASPPTPRTVLV